MVKCFETHFKGGDCWLGFDYLLSPFQAEYVYKMSYSKCQVTYVLSYSSAKKIDHAK